MDASPPLTPSQTSGPFFHDGMRWAVAPEGAQLSGHEWRVVGSVTDANGAGLSDAMLEIWQPGMSTTGMAAPGFQRACTDGSGRFTFIVPCVPGETAVAHVTVFARGLLGALRTRLYPGASVEQLRTLDALRDVPDERLATLVPARIDAGHRVIEWPVRLQGEGETVFFALV